MYTSSLFVAAAAFAGLATAQNLDGAVFNGQNYSISGPIAVPPQNLDPFYKSTICTAQRQQCPQICGGLASNNTCDNNSLIYNCTCANGNQPNISDYQQTIPGQICLKWYDNCIAAHPSDAIGQAGCQSVKCGNRTIQPPSTTTSRTSSVAAGGATSPAASSGAGATTAATTSSMGGAATALAVAQQYGNIAIAGGMAALLGLAL